MKNLNKFKGFTLVEVLIVIIIVGILIAALLPRLTGSQKRARDVARTAAVNQVANGASLLMNDGALTTSGEICVDGLTDLANGNSHDLGDYLSSIPADPQGSSHDNAENLTHFSTCNGGFPAIVDTSNGRSLVICASMEGTNNGNTATFDADTNTGLSDFQTLTSGTDLFCVVAQG